MSENMFELKESTVHDQLKEIPPPREYIWQITPVASVTDQLKIGNLVIINRLPDLNQMIKRDPMISNVLGHLGMSTGSTTFDMHMQFREHIESEETHFLPVAQILRKKMHSHKISTATGLCVYVDKINHDNSRLLMTQGTHVLFNRKVFRNEAHEPRAIFGIVTKDYDGNILDPGEFKKLSNLVAEKLKDMNFTVFKIS